MTVLVSPDGWRFGYPRAGGETKRQLWEKDSGADVS